jgi:DNA-binding NarL/FixJ family response regulator
MNPAKRITVLLAEDHAVVRAGVRMLLDSESDIEVVGEATTGREAAALTGLLRPAVILMDIAMPQLNGLEAARHILKDFPQANILFLSAHINEAYIEEALSMGAAGYLSKQAPPQVLVNAIRQIHRGSRFFSTDAAGKPDDPHAAPCGDARHTKLTPREAEVLQLIAEGAANKQIAADLGISIKTVEKHRDHLMRKLDIHETAGLTRYAIDAGIIECSVPMDSAQP